MMVQEPPNRRPASSQYEIQWLADELQNFGSRLSGGDASGKVRNISPITRGAFFDHNRVTHHWFFNPACFKTLFSVAHGAIEML
jgi:hypothetical protein